MLLILGCLNIGLAVSASYPLSRNNPPVLSNGSVTPTTGNTSTTFTYKVTYSDADNDTPVIKWVYIDNIPYNMSYVSGNYIYGAIYQYSTKLNVGNHTYYFYFYDGINTTRLPLSGTYPGPTVSGSGGSNNPPTLSQGSVSPSAGDNNTLFTYKVTYKDLDNDNPVIKKVYIDNQGYTMSYVSGNNTAGAIYQYKTKLSVGNHNYYFYFTDGNNGSARLPGSGSYSGPIVRSSGPNNSPTLSSGSVTPQSGTTSTIFTYQVIYKDVDNDPPVIRFVYIDGTPYNMSYANGSYTTGAIYQYQTKLSTGNHTYYFYFTDGNGSARLPTNGTYYGPRVTSGSGGQNNAPILFNGFVSPASGNTSTTFTYQVTYKDSDGDYPIIKYVYIDGRAITMNYVSGNYSTGAIYQYKTTLAKGNHTYYFYFQDCKNATAILPANYTYSGPIVTSGSGGTQNNAPKLSNGFVSPVTGTTNTTFTYQVTYKDVDGDPPTIKYVYIDGKAYSMKYVSGSYKTGATYQYITKLSYGYHYYCFFFKDGSKTVKLPFNDSYYGPMVNRTTPNTPPILSQGGVSPQSGTTKTKFTYQVTYKDTDNDPPVINWVYIDGYPYKMTYIRGAYFSGAIYQYTTSLGLGNHTYYFYFSDLKAPTRLPVNGTYNGPIVTSRNGTNSPPTLSAGSVSPQSGTTSTMFTYQVTYKDLDNDIPSEKKIFINNQGYLMNYVSGNHKTGAIYQFKTSLSIGNHTYYFSFKDGIASVRLPTTGSYSGPRVTSPPSNNAPTLYSGSVTPKSGFNTTLFTYQVYYKDLDNDTPTLKNVYINNKPYTMTFVRGSYLFGALFQYQTRLVIGNYNYYFKFSDGTSTVRLPVNMNQTYTGPNVTSRPNNPPKASAGSDQSTSYDSTTPVQFDGSRSYDQDNDNLICIWDFGDGTFGYGAIVEHIYQQPGEYDVTLTVWDGQVAHSDNCLIKIKDPNDGETQLKPLDALLSSNKIGFVSVAVGVVLVALTLIYIYKRRLRSMKKNN